MKKIVSILKVLVLATVAFSFASCEDFMSTSSTRYMRADDNLINSPNDTLFSIVGILSKMQKLTDKYVLSGELRGDLMTVASNADAGLIALNDFKVDTTNLFVDTKDFYSVINNCNYFIQRVDTSVRVRNDKPLLNELIVAKAIRDWTYLQLVLNHGKAYYFTKPILTITEARANYPELGVAEMIDTLINDINSINPLVNVNIPNYGNINGVDSKKLFINPLFILGDLYLWRGSLTHDPADYDQAATYYGELLKRTKFVSADYNNRNTWVLNKSTNQYFKNVSWSNIFSTTSTQLVSIVPMALNSSAGTTWLTPNLCLYRNVYSSSVMDSLFASQTYCYQGDSTKSAPTSAVYINGGDLRVYGALMNVSMSAILSGEISNSNDQNDYVSIIGKYLSSNSAYLYRSSLLYLRFAEAINRAGKPGVAFGILKYGINYPNLYAGTAKVNGVERPMFPKSELADNKPYLTFFSSNLYVTAFFYNRGIHDIGCGDSPNNFYYVLPTIAPFSMSPSDSIAFLQNAVDDKICDELALETGFEGNRFQDLMRLSNHREDPTFLAKRVAAKHKNNYNYYLDLLSDKNNWYLPTKKY